MSRPSAVFTVASVAVLGVLTYAVYFDYKRRNDAQFRKKLRKEKKRIDKHAAQTAAAAPNPGPSEINQDVLRVALAKVRDEPMPPSPEERESYFMSQVNMGEQLCVQGPTFHLSAALCFYRALRVYPSPVELIVIYQKTVPEPVFKIIVELTNLDVSDPSSLAGEGEPRLDDVSEEEDEEMSPTSPTGSGPPSETSSQEWDKLTDPGNSAFI